MSRIETECSIKIYELDGEEHFGKPGTSDHAFKLHSHWNDNKMIVLTFNEEEITVCIDDLIDAANKCRG